MALESEKKKWVHEKYKHRKKTPYKRPNWLFQVHGTFDLENPETGKKEKGIIGFSTVFKDYRERKEYRDEATKMAASGKYYKWVVTKVKWRNIRWRKLKRKK